jgi:L-ribulokinase
MPENGTYSIGLDFGTLSARAVLVDNRNGEEKAISVYGYQHAVIEKRLPGSPKKLPATMRTGSTILYRRP